MKVANARLVSFNTTSDQLAPLKRRQKRLQPFALTLELGDESIVPHGARVNSEASTHHTRPRTACAPPGVPLIFDRLDDPARNGILDTLGDYEGHYPGYLPRAVSSGPGQPLQVLKRPRRHRALKPLR